MVMIILMPTVPQMLCAWMAVPAMIRSTAASAAARFRAAQGMTSCKPALAARIASAVMAGMTISLPIRALSRWQVAMAMTCSLPRVAGPAWMVAMGMIPSRQAMGRAASGRNPLSLARILRSSLAMIQLLPALPFQVAPGAINSPAAFSVIRFPAVMVPIPSMRVRAMTALMAGRAMIST